MARRGSRLPAWNRRASPLAGVREPPPESPAGASGVRGSAGAPTVTRTRIIRLGNERSIHLSYGDPVWQEKMDAGGRVNVRCLERSWEKNLRSGVEESDIPLFAECQYFAHPFLFRTPRADPKCSRHRPPALPDGASVSSWSHEVMDRVRGKARRTGAPAGVYGFGTGGPSRSA